ncbi:hypothetical protein GGE65_007930 [Skermanella aerolata]|uniref:divalent metal cation transporter n=1 Tax=Skermanella aerolata TaxID=393310 RepID=UPI003D1D2B9C
MRLLHSVDVLITGIAGVTLLKRRDPGALYQLAAPPIVLRDCICELLDNGDQADIKEAQDAVREFIRIGKALGEAHRLLSSLLGTAFTPTLFGITLFCCGLNSTATAAFAGQAVMEAFLEIRLPPWVRRLFTRCKTLKSSVDQFRSWMKDFEIERLSTQPWGDQCSRFVN